MEKQAENTIHLTDEQIEHIATKAAHKAVTMMTAHLYQEVGKGVVTRFFWVVGVAAVGVVAWLKGKGVI